MDLAMESPVRPPVITMWALFLLLHASVTALMTPEAQCATKLSSDEFVRKFIGISLQVPADSSLPIANCN